MENPSAPPRWIRGIQRTGDASSSNCRIKRESLCTRARRPSASSHATSRARSAAKASCVSQPPNSGRISRCGGAAAAGSWGREESECENGEVHDWHASLVLSIDAWTTPLFIAMRAMDHLGNPLSAVRPGPSSVVSSTHSSGPLFTSSSPCNVLRTVGASNRLRCNDRELGKSRP